ncbi:hypothetical protein BASA83_006540 [Batrachochytrium salamandrivorans]|nr:hypothetical protein BASA83_006540 [Batrachochytrium salamandrivorans]
MANSDISVPSVDHRQGQSTSTTFSIYGLASRLDIIPPLHSRSNPGSPDGACLQDRPPPTTKHGARFRITVPEDRQRNIIQRLEHQSKQTHWRIRQTTDIAAQTSLDQQPHLHHYHGRSSQSMLPISATTSCYPPYRQEHQALGPSQRPASPHLNFASLSLDSMSSSIQPLDLDAEESPSVSHRALVVMNMSCAIRQQPSCSHFRRLEHRPAAPSAHCPLVESWSDCHAVLWSQITRLSTVHGRRHSSIDHFVCNAPARALFTSPRVDRQTAVADHFVIRTSIRAEAQGQPPVPRAPIISRYHCLEATDRIATSNYWDVLADGATDNTDTDTNIHQLTSQFLESANAVADNLSLRLSPPATRSNRRLLSGTTKRAILASNTARQAFIAAATHTNPDSVQCNTLRDEWSRLKATATQLEKVDGRKQWVKHADNLDRAVSDGRTDLVFAAARAMSGNSPAVLQSLHCTTPMA